MNFLASIYSFCEAKHGVVGFGSGGWIDASKTIKISFLPSSVSDREYDVVSVPHTTPQMA